MSRLILKTVWKTDICKVEMEKCINPLGYSFGKDGWHFIVEYLKEVDSKPTIHFKDSILYRYHKFYQPISMSELVKTAGMEVSFDPGFFRYPWGNFREDFNHALPEKDRKHSRFCGPSDDDFIELEASNILELRDNMKSTGYDPWKFPNSFIGGVFLIKENGDYRFVILQGNHRASIMSYMKVKTFLTRFLLNHYSHIHENNIEEWYYVKKSLCSKEDARKYFNAFFILDGRERFHALDLQCSNNIQGRSFDEYL